MMRFHVFLSLWSVTSCLCILRSVKLQRLKSQTQRDISATRGLFFPCLSILILPWNSQWNKGFLIFWRRVPFFFTYSFEFPTPKSTFKYFIELSEHLDFFVFQRDILYKVKTRPCPPKTAHLNTPPHVYVTVWDDLHNTAQIYPQWKKA